MTTNRRLDPVTHDAVTEIAERSLDDDHYYGAWSQGRGGRSSPTSYAQVRSAPQTGLATSVRKFEDSIRGDKLETIAAFNAQGGIVAQATGDEGSVDWDNRPDLNPVVISHNHPGQDTAPSPFDFTSAIEAPTIHEARTVTSKNTFILRSGPEGFFPGATYDDRWKKAFDYGRLVNKVKVGIDHDLGFGDGRHYLPGQAEMVSARFWDVMAPMMGWSMQKVPHV